MVGGLLGEEGEGEGEVGAGLWWWWWWRKGMDDRRLLYMPGTDAMAISETRAVRLIFQPEDLQEVFRV